MCAGSVKGASARLLKPKVKGAWAYSQACTQVKRQAQQHGQHQALDRALAVAGLDGVMRPGHRRARGQQDQGVQQREVPRIERDDAGRRPGRRRPRRRGRSRS